MTEFRPGIYQHWKGPLYRALFLAQDSTNKLSLKRRVAVKDGVGGVIYSDEVCIAGTCTRPINHEGRHSQFGDPPSPKNVQFHPPDSGASTQEPMVVYVSIEGEDAGNVCVRSLAQWAELVPNRIQLPSLGLLSMVPRFAWVRP